MADTFNKNELILDKVRSISFTDPETKEMLYRLTSLEDSSLNCTAEGDEITDAIGSVITTLYRAKKAKFSATNSLLSLDLAAAQYGSTKEVASLTNKLKGHTYEILEIADSKVTLKNQPIKDSVKFIYSISNSEIGKSYKAGSTVSESEFVISDSSKEIQTPTGLTGKIYVEYAYETEKAVKVANKTSEFPKTCSAIIYAYFRDKRNDNLVYSGAVICPKTKLNPESIELALTSTGKHPFEFDMSKDYCDETNDDLFTIVVSE